MYVYLTRSNQALTNSLPVTGVSGTIFLDTKTLKVRHPSMGNMSPYISTSGGCLDRCAIPSSYEEVFNYFPFVLASNFGGWDLAGKHFCGIARIRRAENGSSTSPRRCDLWDSQLLRLISISSRSFKPGPPVESKSRCFLSRVQAGARLSSC